MPVESIVFKEGKTYFKIFPPEKKDKGFVPKNLKVFYNPRMVANRDLSIMVCASLKRKLGRRIAALEPLSGCGVRGVRLGNELEDFFQIILLNDINPLAFKLIKENIEMNCLRGVAYAFNEDANFIMNLFSQADWRLDYIDVDPFGSPIPYASAAVGAAKFNSSIIAFTATDMSVLCGVYPAKIFSKYGALAARTEYSHETALRILLYRLSLAAGAHELTVKPLISYYMDHYLRVYLSVVKTSSSMINQVGYIGQCMKCLYRSTVMNIEQAVLNCPLCGSKLVFSGPMWVDKICDEEFIKNVLTVRGLEYLPSFRRLTNILNTLILENNMPPFYYDIHVLCDLMQLKVPKIDALIDKISINGFKAGRTHFSTKSVKTDAPVDVLKQILRSLSSEC
ncbi:MAG: tRNA (guanine(10)-N(2))-dimethyltransferase [Candidatus Odinarchaeum yellowstonii]|uniref:tRNA (guanine(26)-N(2))-dimethyltransferase n=1 Tax=Odinarchaeota yellowstonii (strain LCB_4) TaxID=1841599 RepID=A0AAF0D312_ODILC|nr:MAG: tRNA (guanine(10)-N(2))-dimethyltransferase [Candidatus Odinarchaeum yellowstonii]